MRRWAARAAVAAGILLVAAAVALRSPEWAPVLVGFLLGVLGAGAGAVFRESIVEARQRQALLRALRTEIEENVVRLQSLAEDRSDTNAIYLPSAPTVDSAWIEARRLELSDDLRHELAVAYARGSSYNIDLDALNASTIAAQGTIPGGRLLLRNLLVAADRATKAFTAAADALAAAESR